MEDLVCGRVEVDRSKPINPLGDLEPDMTIRRADGSWIFHFVNVVDDIEMGITHVIRGEDHLSNTPKHIELFQALGATPPQYGHIPLILNRSGGKMSKRDQGASVQQYIDRRLRARGGGQLPVPARLVTQGQPRKAPDGGGDFALRTGQGQPPQRRVRHGQVLLAQRTIHPRDEPGAVSRAVHARDGTRRAAHRRIQQRLSRPRPGRR